MSVTERDLTTELPAVEAEEELRPSDEGAAPRDPSEPPEERRDGDDAEQPVNVYLTSAAVFLASSAAGWMAAGVFVGFLPRVVAVAGAALGAGMVALSFRTTRPAIVQYLALPAAIVVGAILVIPDATGGTANLPSLIAEAIRTGGVAQPPVPFDPGWRFILFTLTAFLASAGASLSTGLNRPKLGVALPVPLLIAAALIQPDEATLVSSVVALVGVVGALAVSYGVELGREGATSTGFELRRLSRGGAALAGLVVVLAVLSRAGFLFPDTDRDRVVPPTKPEVQPPQADRVLFEVTSERQGPWRLGVLDVYDLEDEAWYLPPYDTQRFIEIPVDGDIDAPADPDAPDIPEAALDRDTYEATFRINDIEGHVIPNVASVVAVERQDDFALDFDPRTQMFRLPDKRASKGMTYTVSAPLPPSGAELAEAPDPPASIAGEFLETPPVPPEVDALLLDAPTTNRWDRLQFVRNAFYQNVVAAGAGEPADLPAYRVDEMLLGGEGTPYEITAAEVLLARWAGVPSRMGYGFYNGDPVDGGLEVHPRHGSTWLEAYFHGYGWVPIIGKPPKAKASTSTDDQQQDPEIRPTDELALVVYVPIRLQSIRLLYEIVRYYAFRTVPILLGAMLLWFLLPWPVRLARRFRRRRWSDGEGPLERIVVSYAEFRDICTDHNIGDTVRTPLEFLAALEDDAEHREFAWLVTRSLWADLARDLRDADAEAAQDMSRSLVRRVRVAQPALTRILAVGSRTSLRDPYTDDVPNLWPSWARPGALRAGVAVVLAGVGRVLRAPFRGLRRVLPIGGAVLLLLLGACGSGEVQVPSASLPEPFLPEELAGYRFEREEDAEEAFRRAGDDSLVEPGGRVYTVRQGDEVLGSVQAAVFKEELRIRDEDTQEEVLDAIKGNIGSGRFERKRVGPVTIEEMVLPEQRILLWLPRRSDYYELFVARQGFEEADRVFAAVLAFQRGDDAADVLSGDQTQLVDPRRGGPQ